MIDYIFIVVPVFGVMHIVPSPTVGGGQVPQEYPRLGAGESVQGTPEWHGFGSQSSISKR